MTGAIAPAMECRCRCRTPPATPMKMIVRALCALFTVTSILGQIAPGPTPTAAQLAKYDLNKNGRLDPEELAAMRLDESRGTDAATTAAASRDQAVQLTPFTVSTTRDSGYFAENTLAGSRLNTNLADLAASI